MMDSWFTVDGGLPAIDFSGDTSFRYPQELVEIMIEAYSRPGDWILDPFAGFGTTLEVCQRLNRRAVGFETEAAIYQYAAERIQPPCKIHHDRAQNIAEYSCPPFDLLLTSPPFRSFRGHGEFQGDTYYQDLRNIFLELRPWVRPGAPIIIEMVNLTNGSGCAIPRAFRAALELARFLEFEREFVCCNTGGVEVTPGYRHSYLMVFRNGSSAPDAPDAPEPRGHGKGSAVL